MSNLADLEIEDIQEIFANPKDRKQLSSFAHAVKAFLELTRHDGGAESDLIFMTGARISRAGIWDHIPAKSLAANLRGIPLERVELLLETSQADYKQKVLKEISDFKADIAKKPLNEAFAFRESELSNERTGLYTMIKPGSKLPHIEVLPPPPGHVIFGGTELKPDGWPPVTGFHEANPIEYGKKTKSGSVKRPPVRGKTSG